MPLPIVLQLIVTVNLISGLRWVRWRSWTTLALAGVLAGAYLVAIALAGLWLVLPWYLLWLYSGSYELALVHVLRQGRRARWPGTQREITRSGLLFALALGAVALLSPAVSGRRVPAGAVALHVPFSGSPRPMTLDGKYLVRNARVSAQ